MTGSPIFSNLNYHTAGFFRFFEIYWGYRTDSHLVFWKPWPAVKIANLCPKSNGCQVLRYILFSHENNSKFSATCFLSFYTQLTYQLGYQEYQILADQFSCAAQQSGNCRQMVNDPYRVYRTKIPNWNFRSLFVNGKQPECHVIYIS